MRANRDQLKRLPSTLIITAENDSLRNEVASVPVAAAHCNGMTHDSVPLDANGCNKVCEDRRGESAARVSDEAALRLRCLQGNSRKISR
jgi:acetyl esterase/lipase